MGTVKYGWCIFVLFATLLFGCSEKQHKQTESDKTETPSENIGKYVYIDMAGVLHTKQKCKAVFKRNSMQAVTPVRPIDITEKHLECICSQCVSEFQIALLHNFATADYYYDDDVWDDDYMPEDSF